MACNNVPKGGTSVMTLLQPGDVSERSAVESSASYRFVIADDHPLFRGALKEAVGNQFSGAQVFEAGGFEDLQTLLEREGDIDLVLLDLAMPGVRGFSGLLYLRAQFPGVPVVIVSATEEADVIRRCMEFGASGFLPKTLGIDVMRAAIRRVLEGGVWTPPDVDLTTGADDDTRDLVTKLSTLTPQQVRVLMMHHQHPHLLRRERGELGDEIAGVVVGAGRQ